ncbi:MAG: GTP 3',8-cyclase MoaA [Clostridiales bacterium]|nr:GTP 3',8-cyclase MoaA [Clostridiales bacterium]
MTDQYGRAIDYMRISVTDRCNLRCQYCMPDGVALTPHSEILTYEELLRVAAQAVALGVTKFKVTGGEPLVRKGCVDFVGRLKALPGVEQVTMTTNGLLLSKQLEALAAVGLDAVNISLDTVDNEKYCRLTGYHGQALPQLMALLEQCVAHGMRTKVNVVLLEENRDELPALAAIAQRLPVDVRFIELMPIGYGASASGFSPDRALETLQGRWPDLAPVSERRGNGPAHYYASASLLGRIGLIDAVSHTFCAACNRVRLTSTGLLKPCLCYETSTDLKAILRGGGSDAALREALRQAIYAKSRAHCFARREDITEQKGMSQIGG